MGAADAPRVRRTDPLSTALLECGRQRALAVVEAEMMQDPVERVHQQRVAIRRLRSLVRLVEPVIESRLAANLDDDLGWVASSLGDRRDLDVLSELVRSRSHADDEEDTADLDRCLGSELERRRLIADEELRRCLSSKRYRRLNRTLADLDLQSWCTVDVAVDDVVPELMRRQYRRLTRARGQLESRQDYQSWHRMRMRAKNLRYALEPFALTYPGINRCTRRLASLTDVMGQVCDVHNEQELVTFVASCSDVTVAFEGGRRVAQLESRQIQLREGMPQRWARVRRAWKALDL